MIFLTSFAAATLAIFCAMLYPDGLEPYDGNPLTVPSALVLLGTAAIPGMVVGACCQAAWMLVR